MRERLKWLVHLLRMKDGRLLKIVLYGQLFRAQWKADPPQLRWEGIIRKDSRELEFPLECVKRKALNRLGRRVMRSCVGFRWLGVAVNCCSSSSSSSSSRCCSLKYDV